MELEPRFVDTNFGFTLLFVGSLILLTLCRILYPKRFAEFITLPVTDKYFVFEGKNYSISHPFHILLFLMQWVSYATFIFLFLTFFNPELKNNPWLYLQVLTGFGAFVLFKYYFEKLVAHVFMIEQVAHRYLFEKLNYINLIAILIMILNMFIVYVFIPGGHFFKWAIIGIVFLHFITLISSIKRNYQIIFKNIFYFILYLCALEISPLLLLYKVIV